MRDQILISVTQITDDETGGGDVGGFDFTVPVLAMEHFLAARPENRERLAAELERLARLCSDGQRPFRVLG